MSFQQEFLRETEKFLKKLVEKEVVPQKRSSFIIEKIKELNRLESSLPPEEEREAAEILKDVLRFFRTKADFWFPYEIPDKLDPTATLKILVDLINLGEFHGKKSSGITFPYYLAGVEAFIHALKGRDFTFEYLQTLSDIFPIGASFIKTEGTLKLIGESLILVGLKMGIPPAFLLSFIEMILMPEEIIEKMERFCQFLEEKKPDDPEKAVEEFQEMLKKETSQLQ